MKLKRLNIYAFEADYTYNSLRFYISEEVLLESMYTYAPDLIYGILDTIHNLGNDSAITSAIRRSIRNTFEQ